MTGNNTTSATPTVTTKTSTVSSSSPTQTSLTTARSNETSTASQQASSKGTSGATTATPTSPTTSKQNTTTPTATTRKPTTASSNATASKAVTSTSVVQSSSTAKPVTSTSNATQNETSSGSVAVTPSVRTTLLTSSPTSTTKTTNMTTPPIEVTSPGNITTNSSLGNTTGATPKSTSTGASVTPITITPTTTSSTHFIDGLMREQICSQERHFGKPNPCPHQNTTLHCILGHGNYTYGNNSRDAFEATCNEDLHILFPTPTTIPETSVTEFDYGDAPSPGLVSFSDTSSGENTSEEESSKKSTSNSAKKCFCESLGNTTEEINKHCRCYPSLMGDFLKKRFPRSPSCSLNLIYDQYCNITKEENGKRNATCIIQSGVPKNFTEVNCNGTSVETLLRSTMQNGIHDLLSSKQQNCLLNSLKECPGVCARDTNTTICRDLCASVCTELCQTRQVVQRNYKTVIEEFLNLNSTKEFLNGTDLSQTNLTDSMSDTNMTLPPRSERNRREIEELLYQKFGGSNNTLGMILSRQVGSQTEGATLAQLGSTINEMTIFTATSAFVALLLLLVGIIFGINKKRRRQHLKLSQNEE